MFNGQGSFGGGVNEDFFGRQGSAGGQNINNNLGVDLNRPAAAGIQNPDFQPDYYVAPQPKPMPKDEPQPDYYVGPKPEEQQKT